MSRYPFMCIGCGSEACHGDCLPLHRDRYVCHTPWCIYHAPCPAPPSPSADNKEDKKKSSPSAASSNALTTAPRYGVNVPSIGDNRAPAASQPRDQAPTNEPLVAVQFNFNTGQGLSPYTSQVGGPGNFPEPEPELEPQREPQYWRAAQRPTAPAMPDNISLQDISAQEGLWSQYGRRSGPESSTGASDGNNSSRGRGRRWGGSRQG